MNRFLDRDDLDRFASISISVLTELDPKFDLPVDQRWMAPALGQAASHSRILRDSLAANAALIGAGLVESDVLDRPMQDTAVRVVRQILERARTDPKLWASLEHQLPDLAEAAPGEFLEAVSQASRGESPVLRKLLDDRDCGLLSSSPHVGLLWALERLAWSGDHLPFVAQVLARLARLDPGGSVANRPKASLRALFRPWLPRSSATVEQRFQVLERLRQTEPDVAWELLASMLPKSHDAAFPTARPRWRDWAPDADECAPVSERADATRRIVSWMVEDAGHRGSRWKVLIDALPVLAGDEHDMVVDRLQKLDPTSLGPQDREAIWRRLSNLVDRWGSREQGKRGTTPPKIQRLLQLAERFEPEDPISRFGWLFTRGAGLHREEATLDRARKSAVEAVLRSSGLEGLLALAERVELPTLVGRCAAQCALAQGDEDEILTRYLEPTGHPSSWLAQGFATARSQAAGVSWAVEKLNGIGREWGPPKKAQLLHVLPSRADTWELAIRLGEETDHEYWVRLLPWYIDMGDHARASSKLLSVGRPNAAVDLLARAARSGPIDTELALEALNRALSGDRELDPPSDSLAYDIGYLLDLLSQSPRVDQQRVAALEWRFPLVDRHDREPRALHRMLADNPGFFAEVITSVFRAEGEESRREVSAEDQQRAERGHALLSSWRTVPGTIGDPPGVDGEALARWVDGARNALVTVKRASIGEHLIGQMLRGSPFDPDGTWPCRSVRDVLEKLESSEIEAGLEIGVFNSLGVTSRAMGEGGTIERAQSEKYEGLAAAVANQWPRTASLLRRIARGYRSEAKRIDHRSDPGQDLD
ncbi:MAG: hypothetical protein HY815_26575 [Candidatus Riflebacteria bacterium]|nr:hypothetical protein [Candidatus Riflebacteria bacterium]